MDNSNSSLGKVIQAVMPVHLANLQTNTAYTFGAAGSGAGPSAHYSLSRP